MTEHCSYRLIHFHRFICFLLGTQKLKLKNGIFLKVGKVYSIFFGTIVAYSIYHFIANTIYFANEMSEKNVPSFGFVISLTFFSLIITYAITVIHSLTISPKYFEKSMIMLAEIDDNLKFEDSTFFVRLISMYTIFFSMEFTVIFVDLYSMNYQFDFFPLNQYMLFCVEVECFHYLFVINMVIRRVKYFNKQLLIVYNKYDEYNETDSSFKIMELDNLSTFISKVSDTVNSINECYGTKVIPLKSKENNK